MPLYYSQYFRIKHQDLFNKGVYNGCLDSDSLLHVDPLLLKDCPIDEFKDSYHHFLHYFRSMVSLVSFVKKKDQSDPFFKRIVNKFTFSEIPNTGLGFSKGNTHGRGISGRLAIQLADSAYAIIRAGLLDPEIFALMQLIEDNIGADRISDMTISILIRDFLSYTERISNELKLPVRKYNLTYDLSFNVPQYKNKPIIFIPMCILADLPQAHDYEDIDSVCDYNNKLKRKVAEIIGVTWSEYKDYKKKDWKLMIINNRQCYNEAINYYRKLIGVPYDFANDVKEQYLKPMLQDVINANMIDLSSYHDNKTQQGILDLTKAIIKQFKHLVEDNRLSELFHRDNRTPDETDWQLLLLTVADTYIKAGNIDVDIVREDNPGVGEIDFRFTKGSQAKVVIEIKRSGNPNLLHGYRTQLAAYMNAINAADGLFLVIMEDDKVEAIRQKINNVRAEMESEEKYVPEVFFINGKRQYSASNPKYELP